MPPRASGLPIRIFVKPRAPPGRQLHPLNILDVYLPRNISDRLPNEDRHIHFPECDVRINYHNSTNVLGHSSLGYSKLPSRLAQRIKVRTNKGKAGIVDRPVGEGWSAFTIDKLNAFCEHDLSIIATNYQVFRCAAFRFL